ncbi:MAG: carbohydrate kinase family protein [Anaerolineae bacterium]
MPDFDILVVGEVNPDLILLGDVTPDFRQREKMVDDAVITIGGSGVIFACGAVRLGLKVTYSGVVGDDVLSRPADRAILTYLGSMSALRVEQIDPSLLLRSRHVHITSFFLQHSLRPDLVALLSKLHSRGITTSMDTNWDPWGEWDGNLREALEQIDILLPNEQEALAISGQNELDAALNSLSQIVGTVVVKQGAHGAVAQRDEERVRCPGFKIQVADTTGAGDSFDAGFIHAFLHHWSLEDSLSLACACGALSTRAAGGTDAQPTLEDALQLIQQKGEA